MSDEYKMEGSYDLYGTFLLGMGAGSLFTLKSPYGQAEKNHEDKKPPIYMVLSPEEESKNMVIFNTETHETEVVHESSHVFPFKPEKDDPAYKELKRLTLPFDM